MELDLGAVSPVRSPSPSPALDLDLGATPEPAGMEFDLADALPEPLGATPEPAEAADSDDSDDEAPLTIPVKAKKPATEPAEADSDDSDDAPLNIPAKKTAKKPAKKTAKKSKKTARTAVVLYAGDRAGRMVSATGKVSVSAAQLAGAGTTLDLALQLYADVTDAGLGAPFVLCPNHGDYALKAAVAGVDMKWHQRGVSWFDPASGRYLSEASTAVVNLGDDDEPTTTTRVIDAEHLPVMLPPDMLAAVVGAFKARGCTVKGVFRPVKVGTGDDATTVYRLHLMVQLNPRAGFRGTRPVALEALLSETPAIRLEAWAAFFASPEEINMSIAAMITVWSHHIKTTHGVDVRMTSGAQSGLPAVLHHVKTHSGMANAGFVPATATSAPGTATQTAEMVQTATTAARNALFHAICDRLTASATASTTGPPTTGLRNGFNIVNIMEQIFSATSAHHTPSSAAKVLGALTGTADSMALIHHNGKLEDELAAVGARIKELEAMVASMTKKTAHLGTVLDRKAQEVKDLVDGAEFEPDEDAKALKLADAAAAQAALAREQLAHDNTQKTLASMQETLATTRAEYTTRSGRTTRRTRRLIEDDDNGAGPANTPSAQPRDGSPSNPIEVDSDDEGGVALPDVNVDDDSDLPDAGL
jgi:hypothetical protein